MRVMSVVKVALLAAAVALSAASFSTADAKTRLPPGACAFPKRGVANGALCSYSCNPTTLWCAQQYCSNGTLVQVLPCFSTFCSGKCG